MSWCFNQLFGLSFWWHPFTAEEPLVSRGCHRKSERVLHSSDTISQEMSRRSTCRSLNSFQWCCCFGCFCSLVNELNTDYNLWTFKMSKCSSWIRFVVRVSVFNLNFIIFRKSVELLLPWPKSSFIRVCFYSFLELSAWNISCISWITMKCAVL